MVRGIDVSHHQGSIDWRAVAKEVGFAYMKATEGVSFVDPAFSRNWRESDSAGITRGAYHFARPSADPEASAEFLFATMGELSDRDLDPMLDLEVSDGLSNAEIPRWTLRFLRRLEQLCGRRPVLYASPSFWNRFGSRDPAFTRYPLWIAHYTSKPAPSVPAPWSTWTFWQFTSDGSVPGISGRVDLDWFNGNDLAAFTGKEHELDKETFDEFFAASAHHITDALDGDASNIRKDLGAIRTALPAGGVDVDQLAEKIVEKLIDRLKGDTS